MQSTTCRIFPPFFYRLTLENRAWKCVFILCDRREILQSKKKFPSFSKNTAASTLAWISVICPGYKQSQINTSASAFSWPHTYITVFFSYFNIFNSGREITSQSTKSIERKITFRFLFFSIHSATHLEVCQLEPEITLSRQLILSTHTNRSDTVKAYLPPNNSMGVLLMLRKPIPLHWLYYKVLELHTRQFY